MMVSRGQNETNTLGPTVGNVDMLNRSGHLHGKTPHRVGRRFAITVLAVGLAAIVFGWSPTAGAQTVTSVITYNYDESTTHTNAIGRLTSVTETEGGTTVVRRTDFNYDARGRVTSTARFIDGMTYTIQQMYDSLDRVTTVTYPEPNSPEVVTYGYDFAGNLKAVTGVKSGVTTNYVTDIQYDALGHRSLMTFGNGAQTTLTYDPNSFRLQRLRTTGAPGTLQDLNYSYDAVGNVMAITDGVNAAYNESFGYDDLHRLKSATGPYSTLQYAYDQIGNMTCNSQLGSCSATSPNYAYPPSGATSIRPHAVTQAGSYTYSYDANGNMTSGAGRTLTYNIENRPTSITAGGSTVTFAYDYTGERVKKTVAGGTTTVYGAGAYYECSESCTKYIFAGSMRVALKTSGGVVRYFHGNHLGSTHIVTDGVGAKVEEMHYYPYGATYSDSDGEAMGVNYRYTNQQLDAETSLYYYHARYYDPMLGRFVSADTGGIHFDTPQSFNRYTYAFNNPLRYVDPTGYDGCQTDAGGTQVCIFDGTLFVLPPEPPPIGPPDQFAGQGFVYNPNDPANGGWMPSDESIDRLRDALPLPGPFANSLRDPGPQPVLTQAPLPSGWGSFSVDAYEGMVGGGFTFGEDPDGSLFISTRVGAGAGVGTSWNPSGTSPGYGQIQSDQGFMNTSIGVYSYVGFTAMTVGGDWTGQAGLSTNGLANGYTQPYYSGDPSPTGGNDGFQFQYGYGGGVETTFRFNFNNLPGP